jgi:hypothetical protein
MYIKVWFKAVFPLFLTYILLKLKFLMPTVDFGPAMLLAKLRPRSSLYANSDCAISLIRTSTGGIRGSDA